MGTGDVTDGVDHDHDHQPERDRDPDMSKGVVFASTMIAPQPANTNVNVPITLRQQAPRSGDAHPLCQSVSLNEHLQSRHGFGAYPEVGERAALLAVKQARLSQLLEVIADGWLGEIELIGELAHAHRLASCSQQDVHDLQPISISKHSKQALQLDRVGIGER